MRFVALFVRITCAKIAFVAGLGVAPAIAGPVFLTSAGHPAALEALGR